MMQYIKHRSRDFVTHTKAISLILFSNVLLLSGLSGCQSMPSTAPTHGDSLTGQKSTMMQSQQHAKPQQSQSSLSTAETARWLGNFSWHGRFADLPVQLDFYTANDTLHVYGGCNHLSTAYRSNVTHHVSDEMLTIKTQSVASTMMTCDTALMKQEQGLAAWFSHQKFSILIQPDAQQPHLLLTAANDGKLLELVGHATAEQRYGSEAHIMFLEIAPAKALCMDIKLRNCLRVREVFYDTQGIKTGFGQWFVLNQHIENYHADGRRAIVRVKKFSSSAPNTTPENYVLDMLVEQDLP